MSKTTVDVLDIIVYGKPSVANTIITLFFKYSPRLTTTRPRSNLFNTTISALKMIGRSSLSSNYRAFFNLFCKIHSVFYSSDFHQRLMLNNLAGNLMIDILDLSGNLIGHSSIVIK